MKPDRFQKKALDLLLAGLTVPDPVISADAARLLGELARPETMDALLAYVENSPFYSKTAGFCALMQLGRAEACERILPLIENPRVYDDFYWYGRTTIRFCAALSVLALAPEKEPGCLDEACRAGPWTVDLFCLLFSPLILKLDAGQEKNALLRQKTLGVLYAEKTSQPDALCMACRALGQLGGAEAAARLQWLQRHPSRFVRGAAAYHLLKSDCGKAHLEFGAGLLEQEPTEYARLMLAAGLLSLGRQEAAGMLLKSIETEKDFFLRATAVELAGREGCVEARPLLLARLTDAHPYVRQCAIEALETLQAPEGVARMVGFLEDSDPRVRMQAAKYVISSAARGGK